MVTRKNYGPMYFWLILFFFISLFHAVDELSEQYTFNPATEACQTILFPDNTVGTVLQEGYPDYYYMTPDESAGEKCIKWRPKMKCELDPNAEGCVCIEREERHFNVTKSVCKVGYITYDPDVFESIQMNGSTCKEVETFEYITYGSCLKAHDPNECEKGNPDYVWQGTWYISGLHSSRNLTKAQFLNAWSFYLETYANDSNNYYLTEDRNCRHKELKDLSCEELEIAYQKGAFFEPRYTMGIKEWGETVSLPTIHPKDSKVLFEFIKRCGR